MNLMLVIELILIGFLQSSVTYSMKTTSNTVRNNVTEKTLTSTDNEQNINNNNMGWKEKANYYKAKYSSQFKDKNKLISGSDTNTENNKYMKKNKKFRMTNKSKKINYKDGKKWSPGSDDSHREYFAPPQYNYVQSDKKYFDYFPIEDVELDHDPKENDIRVSFLENDEDYNASNKKKKYKKYGDAAKNYYSGLRDKRETKKQKTDKFYKRVKRLARNLMAENNIQDQGSKYSTYHSINDPQINKFTPLQYSFIPATGWNPFYGGPFYPLKYPIRGIYYNPVSPNRHYLPAHVSTPSTTELPPVLPMSFDGRFGAEDDHVVWDITYNTESPKTYSFVQNNNKDNTRTSTHPPLIRSDPKLTSSIQSSPALPASIIRDQGNVRGFRTKPSKMTTEKPATTDDSVSNCVWAIVSCCTRNSNVIRYNCFEQNGCRGAFWNLNPCSDNILDAAITLVKSE